MLYVVLFWPRVDQNTVHIHQNTFIEQVIQHQIHTVLKITWFILNPKAISQNSYVLT